jgi:hypothetical protein
MARAGRRADLVVCARIESGLKSPWPSSSSGGWPSTTSDSGRTSTGHGCGCRKRQRGPFPWLQSTVHTLKPRRSQPHQLLLRHQRRPGPLSSRARPWKADLSLPTGTFGLGPARQAGGPVLERVRRRFKRRGRGRLLRRLLSWGAVSATELGRPLSLSLTPRPAALGLDVDCIILDGFPFSSLTIPYSNLGRQPFRSIPLNGPIAGTPRPSHLLNTTGSSTE